MPKSTTPTPTVISLPDLRRLIGRNAGARLLLRDVFGRRKVDRRKRR